MLTKVKSHLRRVRAWAIAKIGQGLRAAPRAFAKFVRFVLVDVLLGVLNSRTVAETVKAVATVLTIFACLWWILTGNVVIADKLPFIGRYLATYVPARVDRVPVQRAPAVAQTTPKQPAPAGSEKTESLPEVLRVDDELIKYAALAAVDDMFSDEDRLAAAIVNVNAALQRAARIPRGDHVELVADTKSVFTHYEVLLAPGDPPFTWRRQEWWIRWAEANNPEVEATAEQLRAYLRNNPLRLDPNAAMRYLRDKAKTPPTRNEAGIKENMCPAQVASGAPGKYFRFRKDPQEACPS